MITNAFVPLNILNLDIDINKCDNALKLNNHVIDENNIRVDTAVKSENDYETSIFVGNMPYTITE